MFCKGAGTQSCDPKNPRRELIDAYLETLETKSNVSMPSWLASFERAARRRADIHDIEGNPWRCGLWDVMTSVPYVIDDSLRRLGMIGGGNHHGTVG